MRRALALLLLAACTEEASAPATAGTVPLSPTEHLVRASMALRGTRPSLEDLQAVQADPAAIGARIDGWLDSPQFGETIRDLHNDALLLRSDVILFPHVDELVERGASRAAVNRSVMEEPLRLIEHVVLEDRPYTEIVTADYTLADGIVADVWGLPYDEEAGGWQVARWRDGRPAAGILASSTMWLRHDSAGFNYNRGRANVISSALLCFDFLDREVPIDGSVDVSDPAAVAHAVTVNADCVSCHQTMDPLASYLWVFRPQVLLQAQTTYPISLYDAAREDEWVTTTKRPPGYFGDSGTGLDDLATKIAADPRFASCAARRFTAYFAQMPAEEVPFGLVARMQRIFVESGYSAKELAKAIVLSPELAASHGGDEIRGYKKARPEQLARMFEELTGFRWETEIPFELDGAPFGTVDLARSDLFGFRSLAGGIDSEFVTQPSDTMNASASLFLRTYAAKAAGFVVEADFAAAPGDRRLLRRVEASDSDEAKIRAQLADLHLRLFGEAVEPSSVPVTETWSVFRDTLERRGDAKRAWKTTLTAMFQDLRVAYY